MTEIDESRLTLDTISGEALELFQSEVGYRFGLDAIFLATDLPDLPESPVVVELGAGNGAVALSVASRFPSGRVIAVEREPTLFALLQRNIRHNGLEDRVEAVRGDIREYRDVLRPHVADLVLCNPPYRIAGEGQLSPSAERAAAHYELHGGISEFVRAAAYTAQPRGWLKLVLPPARLFDLVGAVDDTDFVAALLRPIHPRPASDAYLMEFIARRGRAATFVLRHPLYVDESEGYSDEVRHRLDHAARPLSA